MEDQLKDNYFQQEESINIRKYAFLLLSNWYWFVLTVILALGVSYLVNRYTLPVYSATTSIILNQQNNQTDAQDLFSEFRAIRMRRMQSLVENEILILKSYDLAKRTVEKLDLEIEYTAHGRLIERKLYNSAPFDVRLDTTKAQLTNYPIEIHMLSNEKYRMVIDDQYNLDTIHEFGRKFENNLISLWIYNTDNAGSHLKYSFKIHETSSLANQYRSKLRVQSNNENSSIITLTIDRKSVV